MIDVRPSVHRKRLGPKWLHLLVYYTWLPPRIKSVSIQSGRDITHSLKTGRNTFTIPGLVSFRSGGKRTSRASSRQRSSGCLSYVLITLLAAITAAALFAYFYVIPTVTTWLHSVSTSLGVS